MRRHRLRFLFGGRFFCALCFFQSQELTQRLEREADVCQDWGLGPVRTRTPGRGKRVAFL